MDYEASEKLQTRIAEAARAAVSDTFNDWDFTGAVEKAYQEYMRELLEKDTDPLGPWYLATDDNGIRIAFGLHDENIEEIVGLDCDLFSVAVAMDEDCIRSQADIILALEHTVARLKAAFTERYGVPFEVSAIDAASREKNPKASYTPWTGE